MSEHTPGPWHHKPGNWFVYTGDGKTEYGTSVATAELQDFAGDGSRYSMENQRIATKNAKLISAAPELLEVLEGILSDAYSSMADPLLPYERMEQAIAKAKGEE